MAPSKEHSLFIIALAASLFLSQTESFKNHQIPRRIQGVTKQTLKAKEGVKELNKKETSTVNVWKTLNLKAKENVRQFFVNRATKNGIPWNEYYDLGVVNMDQLLENYLEVNDASIVYPSYYTQPFHSYEEGNLNWQAALEVLPATLSISANYWPTTDVFTAEKWLRKNTTSSIEDHTLDYERQFPSNYPDTGILSLLLCFFY